MVKWIAKIDWGKAFLSAAIFTVVSTLIHSVESALTMQYYQMPEFFGVWSKLMMPTAGPPPMEFFITSLVFSFISGLSLALVYYYIRDMLPKKQWPRIFYFADIIIGLGFVLFTLPTYLMFNVPVALLISWFISGFIIMVSASFTFVKLLR